MAYAYTRKEMAMGHALVAERLLGADHFLDEHKAGVPMFVSTLFQSLEVSIKHVGIEGGLFTEEEARSRATRAGHGILELATLFYERLNGKDFTPVKMALTFKAEGANTAQIIAKMLCAPEFESTRQLYATRRLVYGEINDGEMAFVNGLRAWAEALKDVAAHLDAAVDVVRQWQKCKGASPVFAIWVSKNPGDHLY